MKQLDRLQDWRCPQCKKSERTKNLPFGAQRFHPCPKLGGLSTPLLEDGTDAHIVVNERQDYINGDRVRLDDDGRPVMNMTTEYADGHTDVRVYMPTARASMRAL